MRIVALLVLAIAAAASFPAGAEDEASPPAAVDVVDVLKLDAGRAQAVTAILDRARERDRFIEAQFGDTQDSQRLALVRVAKQAIRQDAEQQLAAILTEDEMDLLRLMAPAPRAAFGALRFTAM